MKALAQSPLVEKLLLIIYVCILQTPDKSVIRVKLSDPVSLSLPGAFHHCAWQIDTRSGRSCIQYCTRVPTVWLHGGDTSHAFEPNNFAVAQSDRLNRYAFAPITRLQALVHRGAINQNSDHLRDPAGHDAKICLPQVIYRGHLTYLGHGRVACHERQTPCFVDSCDNLVMETSSGCATWLCDLSCPDSPVKVKTTHSAPPSATWRAHCHETRRPVPDRHGLCSRAWSLSETNLQMFALTLCLNDHIYLGQMLIFDAIPDAFQSLQFHLPREPER
jgi:hypothetical protein